MALPTTLSAMGATVGFGTQSYSANVLTFSPFDGAEVPARDVTHLLTTGARQYKPGSLINWGTLTMSVQYDGSRPTMGTAETITITFSGSGSPNPTIVGTGFVSGFSVDASGGDDEEISASLTITWDGDTAPAFTA